MFKPFSFSQSAAKTFLKTAKTVLRSPGLKLISGKPVASDIPTAIAEESKTKILIVIPRRVGNACTRNLIRRRIKSVYYQLELEKLGNIWYALFVYPEAAKLSFEDFLDFFSKLKAPKFPRWPINS
jgi:ribonuclease P protein component